MSTASDYRDKIKGQSIFAEFTNDELDELLDLLDPVEHQDGLSLIHI